MKLMRINTPRTPILFLTIAAEIELGKRPRAILWNNDGLYGLIPVERIENAITLRAQIKKAGLKLRPFCFDWSAVIVVDSETLEEISEHLDNVVEKQ